MAVHRGKGRRGGKEENCKKGEGAETKGKRSHGECGKREEREGKGEQREGKGKEKERDRGNNGWGGKGLFPFMIPSCFDWPGAAFPRNPDLGRSGFQKF